MALIMWLIMRWSCLLSYTDHVPLEAIIKQLSRQELRSTAGNCQAVDRQESCSSAGNCQADEQTVITQLSRPWSRDWVKKSNPGFLPDPGIKPGSVSLQVDSLPTELRSHFERYSISKPCLEIQKGISGHNISQLCNFLLSLFLSQGLMVTFFTHHSLTLKLSKYSITDKLPTNFNVYWWFLPKTIIILMDANCWFSISIILSTFIVGIIYLFDHHTSRLPLYSVSP